MRSIEERKAELLAQGYHECELMTLDEIRELAAERDVPGPSVVEHADDYGGECYCMSCLEYMGT